LSLLNKSCFSKDRSNAFQNIRYFEAISNSRITKEGIDILMQGSPSQSDEAYTQHQSDEKEYGRLTAADSPYKLELLDNQKITA
jgi:hypothetical protein